MSHRDPQSADVPGVLRLNDEAYFVRNKEDTYGVLTACGGWYAAIAADHVNLNHETYPHILVVKDLTICVMSFVEYRDRLDAEYNRIMKLQSDFMINSVMLDITPMTPVEMRD